MSCQRSFSFALLENLPTVAFFAILYAQDDLRLAGWCAAISGVLIALLYLSGRLRPHPILLGINLYMLIVTPFIEAALLLGFDETATFLLSHAQSCVLIAVFFTGAILTLCSDQGFLGVPEVTGPKAATASYILLLTNLLTVVWTFAITADRFVEVGAPLILLFGIRQYLAKRLSGQTNDHRTGHYALPAATLPVAQDSASPV